MKYWLSHLPLEVWVDVYRCPGISRRKWGQYVDRIGNRKYGEYLQFFLHDFCKVTFGKMIFFKFPSKNFPDAMIENETGNMTEIAQTEMPENIRGFKEIQIDHFDNKVLDFCYKLRPFLSTVDILFNFVDFEPNKWDDMAIVLNKLRPLIGHFHSVGFVEGEGGDKNFIDWIFNQPDFQAAISQTNIMIFFLLSPTLFHYLPQWLTAARSPNEPKMVIIKHACNRLYALFIQAITKDFLSAKTPSTFSICMENVFEFDDTIQLKNMRTGEQLVVHLVKNEEDCLAIEILRHKIGAKAELINWLEENKYPKKVIYVKSPTIGKAMKKKQKRAEKKKMEKTKNKPIDAMDAPQQNVLDKDPQEQQSTSKEA